MFKKDKKKKEETCTELTKQEAFTASLIKEVDEQQESIINRLSEYSEEAKLVNGYLDENGFMAEDGHIRAIGQANSSAAIPSIAFTCKHSIDGNKATIEEVTTVPTTIIPTLNAGMRFMAPSKDGEYTEDLGPVTVPCIIGPVTQPTGLYVPFTPEAMTTALELFNNFDFSPDELEDSDSNEIGW